MKRCPNCTVMYEDTFKVCPRDGTPLDEGTVAIPAPQPSHQAETKPVGDAMIGKVIAGRFRITGKLGEGGMGSVYKAEHTKMDRLSAIKILSDSMAHDPDAVARFTREANMSSKIEHPNAIAIYDYGEAEDGLVYLAMEFVEGHTLSSVLRATGPMPPERVLKIAKQIGDALDAAHALTIVHRDLKPDNVMLTRKGNTDDFVKVLDFGIAKMAGEEKRNDLTQAGMVIGTPFYMSPEQVSGEKLDPRSDVYSFALMVYEMLTGRLPFGGENTQAVMISRLTQQPAPIRQHNPHISESVEFAVMRALTRDRDMRTPTAGQFVTDLEDAVAGRDRSATAPQHAVRTSGLETRQGAAAVQAPQFPGVPTAPTPPAEAFATRPSAPMGSAPQGMLPTDAVPTPAFGGPVPSTGYAAAPAPAKSGGAGKVVAAVVAVGLVLVLGGGGLAAFVFRDKLFGGGTTVTGGPTTGPSTGPATTGTTPVTPGTSTTPPATASGHLDSGRQLFKSGDYSGAAAEFRRAIALDPKLADAHANLGAALIELRKDEEAIGALEPALSLDPSNGLAYFNLGLANFRLERYGDAAAAFRKATGLQEDPTAYAYAGFALDNVGDRAGARALYQRYLQEFPKYKAERPTEDTSTAEYVQAILDGEQKAPTGADM